MIELKEIEQILKKAEKEINAQNKHHDLNIVKAKYLGKKGLLTSFLTNIAKASIEEKKTMGQTVNQAKTLIQNLIVNKIKELELLAVNEELQSTAIDVTLPGDVLTIGATHVLNSIVQEIEDLFIGIGYTVEEGPEIETDEYNFEYLNIPLDHPARDMQDTFYINENTLLRTHTSPVQIRTLLKEKGNGKAVKIICPGKVYRRDEDDATHSHQFMQIEGLVVDENITMADLKGTLELLAKKMFGQDLSIRLRPSYFPFTEPSAEVDVTCVSCKGLGCSICKQTGWIEILGSGMVHANVLRNCGYDPEVYSGFAFGLGVERIAMLKYGIDDIRHFYSNDIRFLKQFK